MTNEQILEELRKLKSHNLTPTSEEQANIEREVAEIDESIADYNERIAELEEKLADSNNYTYNDENEERTFTIELLQESFENQLEVMDREDAEYRSLQELATNIFTDYNNEIASLNVEIEAIERRIRKNEVAVRKNIGTKLTEEELNDLNNELATKKSRVATCEEMKEKYIADLSNYGELMTANNRKREIVVGKQNSLNRIIENRKNNPITINKHQLRLDQDELSRLKAGVKALESRKEYITYNPNAEIDKLISAISTSKGVNEQDIEIEEKKQDLFNTYTEMMKDEPSFSEQSIPELEESSYSDVSNSDFVTDTLEENTKGSDTIVVPPMYSEFEDISSHSENEDSVSEEEKEEDEVIDLIAAPSDLDELREAEIEDAKEELKEKKKDKKFVALWNKFSKRAKKIAAAAVAVGLTGILILNLKSCNSNKTKQSDDVINTTPTTTYTQVEEAEKEIEDKIQTTTPTKPSNKEETNATKKPTTSTSTTQPTTTPSTTPTTKPTDSTPTVKPTTPTTKPTDPTPTVKPTEPTVEKETETVELEKGEKIASLDDILNGNLSSDTIISHGDEVGKTIDGAEVKDYTEEGNMEVELEKKDEATKETASSKTPEEIKKALEEFMGGEITFDNDGNQWLDEIQSGKTR